MKLSVCTDEAVSALGLLSIFSSCTDLQANWISAELSQLAGRVLDERPDILLMDWSAYGDLELLSVFKNKLPECRVILWTRKASPELAGYALGLGVRGIFCKTFANEVLLRCVQAVAAGEVWLDHHLTASLFEAKRVDLTPRERDLLALLAQGLKNKEIAEELDLSEGTVKIYVSRLFQKTGLKDRFELALVGLKNTAASSIILRPNRTSPEVIPSEAWTGRQHRFRVAPDRTGF